jgi:competence protein ComEC
MKLIYAGVAGLAGIWLASTFMLPAWAWLAACGLLALTALLLRRTRASIPLLCAAFVCLGGWRYGMSLPRIDESHLAWYNDRGQVSIVGVVAGEPEPDGARWRARIAAEEICYPLGYARVSGLLLATLPAYPPVHDGDLVRVEGELVTPPVWEDFSYKDYLAREGVYSLLRLPSVEVHRSAERRGLGWALGRLRARGEAFIAAHIPEPEASLLTGILLGRDGGISDDVMDAFRDTGTAHIIVISGFNITIIAGMLLAALTRTFGRRWAVLGTIPAVIAYTVLVGGDPPVVRAAIMGCLSLVALQLGRRSDALNALAFTALAMTAARPQSLWDVGFQLSFAATLGIILYAIPLQMRLDRFLAARVPQEWAKGTLRWLGVGFVATLAAQVLTLPITVAYFRNLSPVSLLANLFILPVQPQVMVWGGVSLLLGLVWGSLGVPLGWVAWLFLAYTVRARRSCSRGCPAQACKSHGFRQPSLSRTTSRPVR